MCLDEMISCTPRQSRAFVRSVMAPVFGNFPKTRLERSASIPCSTYRTFPQVIHKIVNIGLAYYPRQSRRIELYNAVCANHICRKGVSRSRDCLLPIAGEKVSPEQQHSTLRVGVRMGERISRTTACLWRHISATLPPLQESSLNNARGRRNLLCLIQRRFFGTTGGFVINSSESLAFRSHSMRYAHNPIAYECEEWSRPDEMALFALLWCTARRALDARSDAWLLDICCGSGMSLLGSVAHPHLAYAVGIDISHQLLDFARQRFAPFRHVGFVCADATCSPFAPSTFDLITASSAYHHMKPSQKHPFLGACRQLLKTGGRLILAENVLPKYSDDSPSYDSAVRALYSAVTDTALAQYPSLPDSIRDMIAENVRLSRVRQYEFKVDYEKLLRDLADAGFVVEQEVQAWKAEPLNYGSRAGNLLLVARAEPR